MPLWMKLALAQKHGYQEKAEGGGAAGAGNGGNGDGDNAGANPNPGAATDPNSTDPGADPGADPGGNGNPAGQGDDAGKKDGDGKPAISDEMAATIKDLMKWKDRARALEQELNPLKSVLGEMKPDDVKTLLDAEKQRKLAELESRQEYDRALEQIKAENQTLVQQKQTEVEALQQEVETLRQSIDELTIGKNFRDSEFVKSNLLTPAIAQREFGSFFEFKDGELIAYDKPRGAKERTPLLDAEGKPKPFEKVIEELYHKHPDAKHIIKSTMKAGAASRSEPKPPAENPAQSNARGLDRIRAGLDSLKQ